MREHLFTLTKKDFKITYFSGSGGGGQHRNKSNNCVRISHEESGVTTIGTEQRSRAQNKKKAFRRLVNNPKFNIWLKRKACGVIYNKDLIEDAVDDMMKESNLKIEYGVS